MKEVFKENFNPIQAIIVFEQEKTYSDIKYYLESRRIELTPKGYQMQEGIPLSKKTISKLMIGIETNGLDKIYCSSIFPKTLLYNHIINFEPKIIWYTPAGYYNLIFDEKLNIPNGQCYLPTLVFKLEKNDLSVFAVKSNNPDENTKLWNAPFHNVYNSGNICMGNAKVKKSHDIIKIMKYQEDAFFNSKFTHLHADGSPIKGNLNTYLTKIIKSHGKFENKVLKPHKKYYTINDLI